MKGAVFLATLVLCCTLAVAQAAESVGPRHAIAMVGEPALPAGFERFAYTDPEAKRGGRLVVGELGSFDSFNPFIIRGTPDDRLRSAEVLFESYVFESLMVRSRDEPFTLYGLLAETIETPDDRSSVTFTIDPRAHFSDGAPVTAEDVLWSWETLRDKGRPNHRSYYSKVVRAERVGARGVRFTFDGSGNRELPLILGLMPILPKHVYAAREFETANLADLPVGTGPYVVADYDAGRFILYRKDPNYWAADHPARRGLFNFDEVRIDYYRDQSSMFQAFKSGAVQFWLEDDPARWETGFDFRAAREGRVSRAAFEHGRPSGVFALVFNTRRPVFAELRVRDALVLPFDFEWINLNHYYGAYRRTVSFFDNSDLAAKGPASVRERELLAPFLGELDPKLLDAGWAASIGGTPAATRANAIAALDELKAAGYVSRRGALVEGATGKPLAFDIMVTTPDQERLALAYRDSLARLGVAINVRRVDAAQAQARLTSYDFDMTIFRWSGTLSPGNEQAYRWGSASASTDGTYNYAGVRSPGVDAMIEQVTASRGREEMIAATRSLDRLLLSGRYVVPLFHSTNDLVAWWVPLRQPARQSVQGVLLDSWWIEDTGKGE